MRRRQRYEISRSPKFPQMDSIHFPCPYVITRSLNFINVSAKRAVPTQKADSLGLYLLTNSSTAVLIQTATIWFPSCSSFISLKLRSCFFSLFKIGKLEVGTQKIPFNPLQVNLYFFQFYSWSSLGSGLICPAIQSVQAETWLPLLMVGKTLNWS